MRGRPVRCAIDLRSGTMTAKAECSLGSLVRVVKATPLQGFCVRLEFEDGMQKEIDLDPYLRGPVFPSIRQDPGLFRSLEVVAGTITRPNGADLDPDVLYYGLAPAWQEVPEHANKGLRIAATKIVMRGPTTH